MRADKRDAIVRIDAFDPVEREAAQATTLVLAVIATDPMDFAVRKAVELGAASIVPVFAARSAAVPAAKRWDKRLAHWRQIAVAACEQCGRNRVPHVATALPLVEWMPDAIARTSPRSWRPGRRNRSRRWRAPGRCARWSSDPRGASPATKIERALAAGLLPVHLGARVLRAETAALAALATVNAVRGDGA